jgi:hypothetical protein
VPPPRRNDPDDFELAPPRLSPGVLAAMAGLPPLMPGSPRRNGTPSLHSDLM